MNHTAAETAQIAQLAYQYWQEDNCAHGKDMEHWLKAEMAVAEMMFAQTHAAPTGAATGDIDASDLSSAANSRSREFRT